MRHYENLVIVKPTLTAEEIQAGVAAVEEVITSNGGEIQATSPMGIRKLAYPINKNERGYYHVVYYTAAPASIAEIERRFRINEEILRFVTIKYDSKREVVAFNQLVEKAKKGETTPAQSEEVAQETPATETEAAAE